MDYSPALRRVIKTGLFALPFLIAVPFTVLTENCNLIKDLLLIFTILFLSFLWASLWLETKKIRLAHSPLNLPVIFFFGLVAVWAFINPHRYISLYELSIFVCYVLLYFLVLNFIDDSKELKKIVYLLFVLFAVVCIYGILQYFGLDFINWSTKGKLLSSFGNPDFFAGYLVLFLPVVLSFFLNSVTPSVRTGLGLLFLAGVFCLIGALTRGAWIGFAVSLFVFALWYLFGGEKRDFQRRLNWVLLLTAVVLVIISLAVGSRTVALRVRSIFDFGKDPSGMVRVIIWDGAFKAFLKRPIFGWGLGGFRFVFPVFRTPFWYQTGIGQYTNHAHNEYLEWLVDTGIIGLGIFLYLLFVFFRESARLFTSSDRFLKTLSLGTASGMIGLLVHNLFSVNLRWSVCGFFFWLMIGLTASMRRIDTRTAVAARKKNKLLKPQFFERGLPLKRPLKFLLYAVFFLILLFVVTFEVRQFLAEKDLQTAKNYIKTEDYDQALNYLSSAVRLNPYLLSAYYQLGHVYNMKGLYNEALKTYRKLESLHPNYARTTYNLGCVRMNMEDWQGALQEFSGAVRLEDSPGLHAKLAEVYLNLGDQPAAEKEYQKTLRLDPAFTQIYGLMADAYLKKGQTGKAEAEFQKIIQKDPSSKDGHFQLARLYENLGRWQESVNEYQKVISLDPMDSKTYNNLGSIYLNLNRPDLAFSTLTKAVALNPGDILAHLNLGRALLKEGKREDAFLEFGRVIKMAPDTGAAREAAKFLASPASSGGRP